MEPILVEVIAPLLDGWGMCSSCEILVKSIRYRVHRYPTFIVNRGKKITGLDATRVEQALISAGATPQTRE